MGMTRVFYYVQKNNISLDDCREKLHQLAAEMKDDFSAHYGEALSWIPLFNISFCEGCYTGEERLMEAVSRIFDSPVIALGCFDSDVSFLNFYKDGTLSRYVCADEYVLEEFGFEEYSCELPEELCQYGISREALAEAWAPGEVFAEDALYEVAALLQTELVFSEDEEVDGAVCLYEEYRYGEM